MFEGTWAAGEDSSSTKGSVLWEQVRYRLPRISRATPQTSATKPGRDGRGQGEGVRRRGPVTSTQGVKPERICGLTASLGRYSGTRSGEDGPRRCRLHRRSAPGSPKGTKPPLRSSSAGEPAAGSEQWGPLEPGSSSVGNGDAYQASEALDVRRGCETRRTRRLYVGSLVMVWLDARRSPDIACMTSGLRLCQVARMADAC